MNKKKHYFLILIVAAVLCTACGKSSEKTTDYRFYQEVDCWNCGATPTMKYNYGDGEDLFICEDCYNELIAPFVITETDDGRTSGNEKETLANVADNKVERNYNAEYLSDFQGVDNCNEMVQYAGAKVYFDGSVGPLSLSVDKNGNVYYTSNITYIYPENSDAAEIREAKTYKIAEDCVYVLCRDVMHRMNSNGEETGGKNAIEEYQFYEVFNQIIETNHWYLRDSIMYWKEGNFDAPTGNEYMLMFKGEFNSKGEICRLEEFYMP